MKELELITAIPSTKSDIEAFANNIIELVKEGNVNALKLKSFLKAFEKISEKVDKETRHEQLIEANKYSEKSFFAFGAKIEVKEVGVRYDFSECNDSVLKRMYDKMEILKAEIKVREEFLKTIKTTLSVNDEETGEVMELFAPKKTSTTSLAFSFK